MPPGCDASPGLSLCPYMGVNMVADVSAKKRPGSAMTRTPESTGKSSSSAVLMVEEMSPNMTLPCSSKWPVKPPPMSSSSMWKPMSSARSKMWRAVAMAPLNTAMFLAPEPTWKETPTTCSPRFLACCRRAGASSGLAPYLRPSFTMASGSSARMRSTQRNLGFSSAILSSSLSVSKVVYSMWFSAAYMMSCLRLQGCAKMMRLVGMPSDSTDATSDLLAQSKPAPIAISRRSSAGSGLHLTA
mmetsp:Transcript_23948/g.52407  ORF Transcript_23948/g.52407 Transcript_23948/m.52407 type:complete len:243 (+) Transcript_23948:547-1275(+)